MSGLTRLVAVIAGLAFPVALALAVYVASAGSLSEPVEGTRLPSETIARPSAGIDTTRTTPTTPATTTTEDVSGPCDEAEHADDPRCTGAATDDEDSGGSGGDDDSSGSGSGSDEDSSGGGDDSSGRGRGRSDSSGSGSGDD